MFALATLRNIDASIRRLRRWVLEALDPWVRALRFDAPSRQTLERGYRLALERPHQRYAGARFNAVHEDRAGAALPQSATKSRPLQMQFV